MNQTDEGNPKVGFHAAIKRIEAELRKKSKEVVFLDSFLVSTSQRVNEREWMRSLDDDALLKHGVARVSSTGYMTKILKAVLESQPGGTI